MVELRGVVINTLRNKYVLHTGENKYEVYASSLPPLHSVIFTNVVTGSSGDLIEKDRVELSGEREKRVFKEISDLIQSKVDISFSPLTDSVMSKLKEHVEKTARFLYSVKELRRHILLRFHNDADGISGAFALSKFLRFHAVQSNSAIYRSGDAIRDLNHVYNYNNPLIILLDFGANEESREGLELLKNAGVELLIIDHHPPMKDIKNYAPHFLSPWTLGEDPSFSKYPAGYLSVEVIRSLGIKEGTEELARISCAGDKSDILDISEKDKEKALVLDYMAAHSHYGNNLSFYFSVFSKKDLFEAMLKQAKDKIEEIFLEVERLSKKKTKGEFLIYIIDFEKIKISEFPSRGKITTFFFEKLLSECPNKPIFVIGKSDRTIILRSNTLSLERGGNITNLIEKVKSSMGGFIESGGGHSLAGALRVKSGYAMDIINEIISYL